MSPSGSQIPNQNVKHILGVYWSIQDHLTLCLYTADVAIEPFFIDLVGSKLPLSCVWFGVDGKPSEFRTHPCPTPEYVK